MLSTQSWKLDDRFDHLKISVYQPCGVDTESKPRLQDGKDDFIYNDLNNAAIEGLPWDSSGALVKVKREPLDSLSAPMSVTLSASSVTVNGDLVTPPDSGGWQTVVIGTSENIFHQLSRFADTNEEALSQPDCLSAESSEMEIEMFDADSCNICLTLTPETRCPSRHSNAQRPGEILSVPFKGFDIGKHTSTPLVFKEVPNASNALEKFPRNKWTSDERELLCILYRWYRCGDDNETAKKISTLFNAITGLDLRHSVIKKQFDHLCLYGAKAFPEVARVFVQTPFNDIDDRNGRYATIHTIIQHKASKLGIELHRKEDVILESGRAAKAKSDCTQKNYERLVHSASQLSESSREAPSELCLQTSIQGRAMLVSPDNEIDIVVNAEEAVSPCPITYHMSTPRNRPDLAFRVFSRENKTVLKPFGFQAARFAHLDELLQEDAPLNCPELWYSHAISHLNHLGSGESGFVSVFINLLQALCNAPPYDANIAVIDLNHPSLTDENNKLHFAYDLLKELRAKNLVPRAKGRNGWSPYRGMCEYVRWGDWPAASFIRVFPMQELEELVAGNTQIASLLRLDLLQEYSTATTAKHLAEQKFILDYANARAMGKLAKTFGLCGDNAAARHITEFIRHLVEGWSIEVTSVNDLQTLSDIAFQFAVASGSERPVQETMGAFIDGIREGMEGLKRWRPRHRS